MAVERDRKTTITMRREKTSVGGMRGMTSGSRGKVTAIDMIKRRTREACNARDGDNYRQLVAVSTQRYTHLARISLRKAKEEQVAETVHAGQPASQARPQRRLFREEGG